MIKYEPSMFTGMSELFKTQRGGEPVELVSNGFGDLSSVIRDNEWIENPLSNYENYTYNISLFAIDQSSAAKFMEGSVSLEQIHSGDWEKKNKIIIAETARSAEIHIDDLEIHSVGNVENGNSGGVATKLSFTLTGVGQTYIIDKILDTASVLGYPSIANAIFFMEISFKGYIKNRITEHNERRIFPFIISKYRDIPTETTVSGTVATFEGIIASDAAMNNENDFCPVNVEFEISDSLDKTVETFIEKLNNAMVESNFVDSDSYINTYEIQFSDKFKLEFGSDNPIMDANIPNMQLATNKSKDKNATGGASMAVGGRIAILHANTSIRNTVRDLILKSVKVSDALTKSEKTTTKVPNIRVTARPKQDGFNYVTGEQGYRIKFYVSLREELVDQTLSDSVAKSLNANAIVDRLKDMGRLSKIYFSDYTGMNTDIIQFNVSLNQQLTKTYNSYIDENIVFDHIPSLTEGNAPINERGRQRLNELENELVLSRNIAQESQEAYTQATDALQQQSEEFANKFRSVLRSELISSGNPEVAHAYDNLSTEQILSLYNNSDDDLIYGAKIDASQSEEYRRYEAQQQAVAKASGNATEELIKLNQTQNKITEIKNQVTSRAASDEIRSLVRNQLSSTELPEVMLAEDLTKDVIFKLSDESVRAIIETIRTNPGLYKGVSYKYVAEDNKLVAVPSNTGRSERLVLDKYQEAHNLDLSMYQAQMTIKGDPFWIEHFIDPETIHSEFTEDKNIKIGTNDSTTINGYNTVMVVRNAINGSDYIGNPKINNLFTYIYFVKNVVSTFSGGTFTQQLDLIRLDASSNYSKKPSTTNGTEDPVDENTDNGLRPSVEVISTSGTEGTFDARNNRI